MHYQEHSNEIGSLKTMDIRKLRHVALLSETLHFARAADRAHLTQSALSRSIQALEGTLGLRLFDRQHGTGGVTVTPAGRQLLERARPLLLAANDLDRDMNLLRDASLGDLHVGGGPFPSATLLPAALVGLQRTHPALHVSLQIGHAQALCALLLADRIELFVADTRALPREGLAVQALPVQHGMLFCRATHPLARRRRVSKADMAHQRYASVHLPDAGKDAMRRMLGLKGDIPSALTCDNVYLLKELARRSDVVLVCTEEALAAELASGEFVRLRLEGLRPVRVHVGIVTRKGRTLSPAASLFMARLAEEASAAGDGVR
jgi:DNA-binding transcriptional LysR family regulator